MMRVLSLVASLSLTTGLSDFKHMNPDVSYTVSNPPAGAEGMPLTFRGDAFFHVDSPKFKSQYSQVVWHTLAPVALPADVVSKFDGKVMSVTGWEVDVLRDVVDKDGKVMTESVPW